MSKGILIEERNIVIPGDTIAEGMDYLPGHGTYRQGEEIRASVLGLTSIKSSVIKVVPLSGAYIPRKGDKVIGQVTDVSYSSWEVDIRAPAPAMMGIGDASRSYIELGEELGRYYDIGDYVYCEVTHVNKSMYIKVNMKDRMFKKLETGLIINVSPVKVPRLIGKQGSMVNTLKTETNCSFIVGQNGIVWIKGDNRKDELIALKAIKYIEENAHLQGLTDSIKNKIGEWKK